MSNVSFKYRDVPNFNLQNPAGTGFGRIYILKSGDEAGFRRKITTLTDHWFSMTEVKQHNVNSTVN